MLSVMVHFVPGLYEVLILDLKMASLTFPMDNLYTNVNFL